MACQLLEIEAELEEEYKDFIKTNEGRQWIESWNGRTENIEDVGFGEYLYDFYPEMLLQEMDVTKARINITETIKYMQDVLTELNSRQSSNDSSKGCINYLSASTSAELCDIIAEEAMTLKNHWYT